jgi:chromosome segregation ATPase
LARTADELRARFEERLQFKDETIRNLNSQIDDLQALLQNAQKPGRGVEQQLEELRRENGQLRDQLNSKFFKELGDDALSREVAAIRDPGSFAAVKTILAKMTKQREEIQRLNEQIASSGDLQKSLTDLTTKYKQKDTEVKTLTSQIKSQHIQIEFLQREYDFMQNKIAQGKPVNIPAPAKEASASQITQASDFYVKSVKEVASHLSRSALS